jgi:hypothetical protein
MNIKTRKYPSKSINIKKGQVLPEKSEEINYEKHRLEKKYTLLESVM